uniref:Uncharacterized protein n=1 Tax=Cavia porcellus TaxID=10141 RepID=A0A286XMX6_CAVPO
MKATHRSRWLSRSVSGLSRAGTNRVRKPSNPASAWKAGSESTVSTAVMYSPGRTSSIRSVELAGSALGFGFSQPWWGPCTSNMAAPSRQAA